MAKNPPAMSADHKWHDYMHVNPIQRLHWIKTIDCIVELRSVMATSLMLSHYLQKAVASQQICQFAECPSLSSQRLRQESR